MISVLKPTQDCLSKARVLYAAPHYDLLCPYDLMKCAGFRDDFIQHCQRNHPYQSRQIAQYVRRVIEGQWDRGERTWEGLGFDAKTCERLQRALAHPRALRTTEEMLQMALYWLHCVPTYRLVEDVKWGNECQHVMIKTSEEINEINEINEMRPMILMKQQDPTQVNWDELYSSLQVDRNTHQLFFHGTSKQHALAIVIDGVQRGVNRYSDLSREMSFSCFSEGEAAVWWAKEHQTEHPDHALVIFAVERALLEPVPTSEHKSLTLPDGSASEAWYKHVWACVINKRRSDYWPTLEDWDTFRHQISSFAIISGPVLMAVRSTGGSPPSYELIPHPSHIQWTITQDHMCRHFTRGLKAIMYI